MSQKLKQRPKSKRYIRRRRLVISLAVLFLILVVTLVTLGIRFLAGIIRSTSENSSSAPAVTTTEQPTTTTTTYPTIPADVLDNQITARCAILYDATHDTILYSRNANEKCYPASMTKLLTAAIAVKLCSSDAEFEVGNEISLIAYDSTTAGLKKGDRLTMEMILDALLLPSGNDAAYVIATYVGRQAANNDQLSAEEAVAVFAGLMNETAVQIGALSSHFMNPDGYHHPDHYTTAADMLRIAQYAMSFPEIKRSVSQPTARHVLLSGRDITWTNTNALLIPGTEYAYSYANGIKTGTTDEAGPCLAASANKFGVDVYAIVIDASTSPDRFLDAKVLLEAAFKHAGI